MLDRKTSEGSEEGGRGRRSCWHSMNLFPSAGLCCEQSGEREDDIFNSFPILQKTSFLILGLLNVIFQPGVKTSACKLWAGLGEQACGGGIKLSSLS